MRQDGCLGHILEGSTDGGPGLFQQHPSQGWGTRQEARVRAIVAALTGAFPPPGAPGGWMRPTSGPVAVTVGSEIQKVRHSHRAMLGKLRRTSAADGAA